MERAPAERGSEAGAGKDGEFQAASEDGDEAPQWNGSSWPYAERGESGASVDAEGRSSSIRRATSSTAWIHALTSAASKT
jgi:hypothetical protein